MCSFYKESYHYEVYLAFCRIGEMKTVFMTKYGKNNGNLPCSSMETFPFSFFWLFCMKAIYVITI